MCIRDSFRASQGHGAPNMWGVYPHRGCFVVWSSAERSPHLLPPGAVSYTHLTLPTICSV
eukprot:10995181-Alexandrium_andersonii.AAC.1